MAWLNLQVCDICKKPSTTRTARPVGDRSLGVLICPSCARGATITTTLEKRAWLLYLHDRKGNPITLVGTVSAGDSLSAQQAILVRYQGDLQNAVNSSREKL